MKSEYHNGFFVPAMVLAFLVVLFIALLFGLRLLNSETDCQIEEIVLIDPEKYPPDRALSPEEFEELKRESEKNYEEAKKKIRSECK